MPQMDFKIKSDWIGTRKSLGKEKIERLCVIFWFLCGVRATKDVRLLPCFFKIILSISLWQLRIVAKLGEKIAPGQGKRQITLMINRLWFIGLHPKQCQSKLHSSTQHLISVYRTQNYFTMISSHLLWSSPHLFVPKYLLLETLPELAFAIYITKSIFAILFASASGWDNFAAHFNNSHFEDSPHQNMCRHPLIYSANV